MTAELRLGLRFDRRDFRLLRELAQRVRRNEIQGDAGTFELAAQAAATGEPLIVICQTPEEAHIMAAGYARIGCRQVAVEHLSGDRAR